MMIAKVALRRGAGSSGALAKLLLDGASTDRGHGLLWSLFGRSGDEKRAFLYRQIEPGRFITVSPETPQDAHGLWQIDAKPYAPDLKAGQRLGFVLRANPAIAVKTPGAKRGKRADAIMHAKYAIPRGERSAFTGAQETALAWLIARGNRIGVEFDGERCSATGYNKVIIRKPPKEEGGKPRIVIFSEIDYEGILAVTDPEKLTAALFSGIGKARAYGCGLMLVRPTG